MGCHGSKARRGRAGRHAERAATPGPVRLKCGRLTVRSRLGLSFSVPPALAAHGRLPEWPKGAVCKTVGSAYVGSNPTPATTCENGPLAANSRASGPFPSCPAVCHRVRSSEEPGQRVQREGRSTSTSARVVDELAGRGFAASRHACVRRVGCPARSRARCGHGPFPGSLPPNPACAFQRTGLSSDLCRSRDRGRVDVVMAAGADDEGLAPHSCHEGCPRGLARPGPAEMRELGDLVGSHRRAVLA